MRPERLAGLLAVLCPMLAAACRPSPTRTPNPDPATLTTIARARAIRDSLRDVYVVIQGIAAPGAVLDTIPDEEVVSLGIVRSTGLHGGLVLMIDRCGLERVGRGLDGRSFIIRSAPCPWRLPAPRANDGWY